MHYYQFNIGDYASSTQHLEPLEDLAYRRMLDLYYQKEKPLPKDVKEIARLIRMRPHCECIELVLQDFFTLTANGYTNHGADKVLGKTYEKSEKAKKAAEARWSKNKDLADADAMQTHSKGDAGAMPPNTHNPIPITRNTNNKGVDFSIMQLTDSEVLEVKRIRKLNKGGSLTQRVVNALAKEFNSSITAGYSVDEILTEWECRGWKSFKADWMPKRQGANGLSQITQKNLQNLEGEW